jgi:hypothetical protein
MAIGETDLMDLPARTSLPSGRWVVLRAAARDDIPALAMLIADDELGSRRDGIENAADLARGIVRAGGRSSGQLGELDEVAAGVVEDGGHR